MTQVHPDFSGEVRGTVVAVSPRVATIQVPTEFRDAIRADFASRQLLDGNHAIALDDSSDQSATIQIPITALPSSLQIPNARVRVVFGVASWTVVAFPDDPDSKPHNNVWPLSCGIHAANAFLLHSTRALVV